MDMQEVAARGLVLLGCGQMGSALLDGLLLEGIPSRTIWVLEPRPSEALSNKQVHLNDPLPKKPAVVLIAVKPQMMQDALPQVAAYGNTDTLFISVAAGTTIAQMEAVLGAQTPIVRAMPNTPAAIGQGITAITANKNASPEDIYLAEAFMRSVGQVVRLDGEHQIDAVTAVSGSGPAYVFLLIEAMTAAARAEGLPPEMALQLARATVAGAGALAEQSKDSPTQLRVNVTSPAGTTAAALEVLMNDETGLAQMIKRAVAAAAARGRALGK